MTIQQDPEKWTGEVWVKVYGFAPRKGEGWASRKDIFFVGMFRVEHDPKGGFLPMDCQNPREHRVIEFILPILIPEKSKRLSITMVDTLFGALSGVRPFNWGTLPHIGKKPSFFSPYILHLYQQHGCINEAEEDALKLAEDEVVYKLGPEVKITESGTIDSSNPAVPEPPPAASTPSGVLVACLASAPPGNRTKQGTSLEEH